MFASVKIPINDADRAYATGEWDAGAGVTFGGPIGSFYGHGEAGYWVLGDPPEGELRDPWVLRLELGRRFGRWWGAVAADGAGETVPGFGSAASVEAIVRRQVGERSVLGGVVAVGLTDAAPDVYVAFEWQLGG